MTASCITLNNGWLSKAAEIITKGGIVALPYERLFGLAADAFNLEAVAKAAATKDRDLAIKGGKPISVILPSIDYVQSVALDFSETAYSLAKQHWPGPLTLVVKAKQGLSGHLVSKEGFIGLRVPGDSPALELARSAKKILTATSANHKDAIEPLNYKQLLHLKNVDLIVKSSVKGPPGSTVVKIDGNAIKLLRQGIIILQEIKK